ncbi:hypothetical protein L9F63_004565, partial [Diploptera punctata]
PPPYFSPHVLAIFSPFFPYLAHPNLLEFSPNLVCPKFNIYVFNLVLINIVLGPLIV